MSQRQMEHAWQLHKFSWTHFEQVKKGMPESQMSNVILDNDKSMPIRTIEQCIKENVLYYRVQVPKCLINLMLFFSLLLDFMDKKNHGKDSRFVDLLLVNPLNRNMLETLTNDVAANLWEHQIRVRLCDHTGKPYEVSVPNRLHDPFATHVNTSGSADFTLGLVPSDIMSQVRALQIWRKAPRETRYIVQLSISEGSIPVEATYLYEINVQLMNEYLELDGWGTVTFYDSRDMSRYIDTMALCSDIGLLHLVRNVRSSHVSVDQAKSETDFVFKCLEELPDLDEPQMSGNEAGLALVEVKHASPVRTQPIRRIKGVKIEYTLTGAYPKGSTIDPVIIDRIRGSRLPHVQFDVRYDTTQRPSEAANAYSVDLGDMFLRMGNDPATFTQNFVFNATRDVMMTPDAASVYEQFLAWESHVHKIFADAAPNEAAHRKYVRDSFWELGSYYLRVRPLTEIEGIRKLNTDVFRRDLDQLYNNPSSEMYRFATRIIHGRPLDFNWAMSKNEIIEIGLAMLMGSYAWVISDPGPTLQLFNCNTRYSKKFFENGGPKYLDQQYRTRLAYHKVLGTSAFRYLLDLKLGHIRPIIDIIQDMLGVNVYAAYEGSSVIQYPGQLVRSPKLLVSSSVISKSSRLPDFTEPPTGDRFGNRLRALRYMEIANKLFTINKPLTSQDRYTLVESLWSLDANANIFERKTFTLQVMKRLFLTMSYTVRQLWPRHPPSFWRNTIVESIWRPTVHSNWNEVRKVIDDAFPETAAVAPLGYHRELDKLRTFTMFTWALCDMIHEDNMTNVRDRIAEMFNEIERYGGSTERPVPAKLDTIS